MTHDVIEIPTYWSTREMPTQKLYDHPTPITEEGTLGRLLASLTKIDSETLIFPVPLDVEERVGKIVKGYEDLDIKVFSSSDLARIREDLGNWGFPQNFIEQFKMSGYGRVRNMGLVMGAILGAENLILLDDDEVVLDGDFIEKATEFIGKRRNGKIIGGIAGYYIDENNAYMLEERTPWWKHLWNKERKMNEAFRIIESRERLNDTTFAFGGNMVVNKALFKKVPFDPWISRGEDIDFMLNAKFFGFDFLLDSQLRVKHLPPKPVSDVAKMRNDIYRFMYQREKLKLYDVSPSELDPYPGAFLKSDLGARAFITSMLLGIDALLRRDLSDVFAYIDNARSSLGEARKYAERNVKRYLKFQENWAKLMSHY
ncbi:MAG: hypothetical protein QMD78_03770 [Methanocellales archaeon]|nr:hypothetical protein [Methanocellales archaeon]